jgi:hypothetical protein
VGNYFRLWHKDELFILEGCIAGFPGYQISSLMSFSFLLTKGLRRSADAETTKSESGVESCEVNSVYVCKDCEVLVDFL